MLPSKDLGAQTLKNISRPVRAYRIASTSTVSTLLPKAVEDHRPYLQFSEAAGASGPLQKLYAASLAL